MVREVAEINQIRDTFCEALTEMLAVTSVLPSESHFVLVSFKNIEPAWHSLTEAAVVARRIPHPQLLEAIRFTIGTAEEMSLVTQVLKRLS